MDIFQRFESVTRLKIEEDKKTIGVLSEKTLHKTIKNLYEEDVNNQEIKIGSYYVDILNNDNIIEIQTKQFNKLRIKLDYLLKLNKYKINVVYPVFNKKDIYIIEEDKITGPRKSPKKLQYPEIFYELYKIKQLLNEANLTITVLVLDIDEYRTKGNSRSGVVCFDRIPKKLIDEIKLVNKEDYLKFLPEGLNDIFTATDVIKQYKCKERYVRTMLNVLCHLEVIEVIGKENRKYLYKIKK